MPRPGDDESQNEARDDGDRPTYGPVLQPPDDDPQDHAEGVDQPEGFPREECYGALQPAVHLPPFTTVPPALALKHSASSASRPRKVRQAPGVHGFEVPPQSEHNYAH